VTINHLHCGGYRAPSNNCQVHWWNNAGEWISYPIRVPNWHQIRTLTFDPAPEHGELPLFDPVTIVYVGPAAPYPALPPVRFHTDDCHLDICDGGCLYG
jgi:hypothetical protein